MDRQTLRDNIPILTERELRLKAGEDLKNPFYVYLESIGRKNEKEYYHLPNGWPKIPGHHSENTIWDFLYHSPRQQLFKLTKSVRYFKEPFGYGDFIGLRYCYSGSVTIKNPYDTFELHANDCALMNANVIMKQYLAHDEDMAFTLMFHKDVLLGEILRVLGKSGIVTQFIMDFILNSQDPNNRIVFHGGNNERLVNAVEDIVCEFIEPTEYGEVLIEAYLKILFAELMGSPFENNSPTGHRPGKGLVEMLQYIDIHYSTVTLDELADHFGYSSKYVSRMIAQETGRNFKDFVLEKKLKQACMLLENTVLPITEIIPSIGMTNETFFYRKFKDSYGCSPAEYRTRFK